MLWAMNPHSFFIMSIQLPNVMYFKDFLPSHLQYILGSFSKHLSLFLLVCMSTHLSVLNCFSNRLRVLHRLEQVFYHWSTSSVPQRHFIVRIDNLVAFTPLSFAIFLGIHTCSIWILELLFLVLRERTLIGISLNSYIIILGRIGTRILHCLVTEQGMSFYLKLSCVF